jgi:hypothetical protein
MRGRVIPACLTLAGCLLAGGCAAPPDTEIRQARDAIESARAAGAERYAAEEFQAARTALDRSTSAVTRRDFRQALTFALDSREHAQHASRIAAEQRRQVRDQAVQALEEVESAVAVAHQRVESAATDRTPRSRAEQLQISDIRRAIVVANVAVQKAREAIANEDYAAAQQAVTGVADHLKSVVETKPAARVPAGVRRAPRP